MNDFAGSADAIAEKLVAGGMDPQQAMMMALRLKQEPSGSLALRPAENMSVIGKSMNPPGLPESVVSDTVGIIKNMDDASVIATASRMTGLPFDSPIQARLMLEKMLGGGASISAGLSGIGSGLPQRLTGYEVEARFPALGGQVGVGAAIPRGQGSPAINLNYQRQFQEGGSVLASDTDKIAEQLIAGGVDPQQAMTLALRMAQSRQQADQSILGGVPTQPPVSDVPPATEILGGDPSKLFQRQPTAMERIKDLPKDVLGAADAMASMGSLVGLAVPSMMYALRPGQKTQGDPMEFALRNMYMPRSERGPSHLAGLGEVLESLPQTGPLPELQAFAGVGRGVGRQLTQKAKQAGEAMAPKAADIAEDILSRQGLLMQAAPSGPTRVEAPASSLGFYDPVHQAALNIQRKQGPGQAFLNELQRSENVNKEFLEASGLAEKLRTTPNITREEVQSLAKGAVPEIQEVVYGNTSPEATQLRRQIGEMRDNLIAAKEDFQNSGYLFREIRGNDMINALPEKWQFRYDRIANMQRQYDELVDQEANLPSAQPTKYTNYQLPGGENYREVLLTIPIDREKYARSLVDPAVWSRMTEEQRAEFMNAPIRGGSAGTFKSAHWEEPNVVSHIRMNDRTDAEGKKVLFIEEIQSDWAQEGRKKGFYDKNKPFEVFNVYTGETVGRFANQQEAGQLAVKLGKEFDYLDERKGKKLSPAPFVGDTKEWVDLSLKNIIKRAVDEGYDRVAFVNGAQSADRYDLSKQVESISYQDRGDGTYRIIAAAKNRGVAIPEQTVSRDKLPDVVGQEVAKKIVSGEGKEFPVGSVSEGMRSLSGLDLKVGGEGMKAFYDKLVPERVNAILKRFGGGKATTVSIGGQVKPPNVFEFASYDQYKQAVKEQKDKKAPTMQQIGFDITPAMRERFQKPIPYKQGGSVNHKAVESARRALEKAMGGEVKMGTGGSMLGAVAGRAAGKAGAKAAKPTKPTKFELAQRQAQINAAKPIEEGGLGLRPDNTADERAAAQGYIDYYHGTERLDRLLEKPGLDPKRATSGPMPYGTTTRELASNYAMSKADTSRRAEDLGEAQNYFQVSPKDMGLGFRSPLPVERLWYFLSPEQKQKVMSLAPRVGYENLEDFSGKFTVHPEGVNATLNPSHWDFIMKQEAKGNPLTALRQMWYESGQLVDDPSQLAEIYRLAGIDAPISQTNAPWASAQGVLLGKARVKNALDTSNVEQVQSLIPKLEEAFKRDRSRMSPQGTDQWDKRTRYTPKQWVDDLKKDIELGQDSYVWTSIPDKVTNELKRFGFDSIIDKSGKGGGSKEPVVIPFSPEQIRSRFAAFDPMEQQSPDLLKKKGGLSALRK